MTAKEKSQLYALSMFISNCLQEIQRGDVRMAGYYARKCARYAFKVRADLKEKPLAQRTLMRYKGLSRFAAKRRRSWDLG